MMKSSIVMLVAVAPFTLVFAAQQAPPREPSTGRIPAASISGRVVSAENGAPLRRAQVRLTGSSAPEGRTVLTDSEGQFVIEALAAGGATVIASKAGYVELGYGQRRPEEAGRSIVLTAGGRLEGIEIALPRAGVIAATITNERGEPVADIPVQVHQMRFRNGERRPANVNRTFTVSNDLGEARVYGLAAGDYYVVAGGGGTTLILGDAALGPASADRIYVDSYFPGTSSWTEAQRVSVRAGQEVAITLPLVATKLVRVSGRVASYAGTSPSQLSASLGEIVTDNGASRWRPLPLAPDGSFSIDRVTPGRYAIQVDPQNAPGSTERAMMPIIVTESGVSGLIVTTSPGATIQGRYVFAEGQPSAAVRPTLFRMSAVMPELTGWSGRQTTFGDDWTFELTGVIGRGVLRFTPPPGWFLQQIVVDGRDITDLPIEFDSARPLTGVQVLVTQKQAVITGSALSSPGQPAPGSQVVVFPEDPSRWTPQTARIAAVRADAQGQFRVAGLPGGQYYIAAVDYLVPGDERDPELLDRLREGAETASVALGEERSVSLKLQKLP